MKSRLTWFVVIAMITGPLFGLLLHQILGTGPAADNAAAAFALVTSSFLRLIKMIIAPLVFSTLVVGVARMEGAASIARIGAKALGWFVLATLASMTIGLAVVQLFKPGLGLSAAAAVGTAAAPTAFHFKDFVDHIIPTSVVQAMANNEILQIVVFSVFFGAAASALGPKVKTLIDTIDEIAAVILRVDPVRHGVGASGHLCSARRHRLEPGPERPGGVCKVHRQFLSGPGALMGVLRLGSVCRHRQANCAVVDGDPLAPAVGILNLQLGSSLSADFGTSGVLRGEHPHCLLRNCPWDIPSTSAAPPCIARLAYFSSRRSIASI